VPGVLDGDDAVVDRIGSFDEVADVLGASEATDVTGGMAGKVRALLDLEVPAQIFGPDALASFVAGESPGTTIDAR
jgi:isopentenyl phosphate kinase